MRTHMPANQIAPPYLNRLRKKIDAHAPACRFLKAYNAGFAAFALKEKKIMKKFRTFWPIYR